MSDTHSKPIHRYEIGGPPRPDTDHLTAEEPLEIRIGGQAVSVTMRTPGQDEELACGFLLSEGIIRQRSDVAKIDLCPHDRGGNVLNVTLCSRAKVDFGRLTRHVFASSSCGVCGKATIDAIHDQFEPIQSDVAVNAARLLEMPRQLRDRQPAFDRTGGLHAAAIFTTEGQLLVVREDVGRHNAVDKAIGYGFLHGLGPFDRHVLLVSGRASFEIMQKALAGRIPIVAAVSAPSSLAVDFAAESNQALVGFLRAGRMNIYAGMERIRVKSD